jgi:hypothetical protein
LNENPGGDESVIHRLAAGMAEAATMASIQIFVVGYGNEVLVHETPAISRHFVKAGNFPHDNSKHLRCNFAWARAGISDSRMRSP